MTRADTLDAIFKAYDVRGLVDSQLDADTVRAIGAAAAAVLGDEGGTLVVGHDMRPSSRPLVEAFTEGVTSQGIDVVDIGLASTDMLYYASGILEAPGAMFTASHNPSTYNGIKLCRAGAMPVSTDTGLSEIRDRAKEGTPAPVATPGSVRQEDVLGRFGAHVRSFVDTSVLRPLRIAIDAGNGMAGHVVPAVFEGLPFDIEPLFFELDGSFPNHPANPIEPENLRDLQRVVREQGLPLGLAFDGDADRMFAVDERGEPVPSSLIGAVVADRLLAAHPGETILYNLICSHTVPETVEAAGGTAIRTRVGHSYIKATMAETGAIFGAEHSGHYYFRDNFRADSGLIAALVLLEAVAAADAPLSEVVAPYDRYAQSGEINFEVGDAQAVMDAVADAFADRGTSDLEDGLTVQTDAGWFNLRPSNTEPLLRLNVEAADQAAMDTPPRRGGRYRARQRLSTRRPAVSEETPVALDEQLLEILICTDCHGDGRVQGPPSRRHLHPVRVAVPGPGRHPDHAGRRGQEAREAPQLTAAPGASGPAVGVVEPLDVVLVEGPERDLEEAAAAVVGAHAVDRAAGDEVRRRDLRLEDVVADLEGEAGVERHPELVALLVPLQRQHPVRRDLDDLDRRRLVVRVAGEPTPRTLVRLDVVARVSHCRSVLCAAGVAGPEMVGAAAGHTAPA